MKHPVPMKHLPPPAYINKIITMPKSDLKVDRQFSHFVKLFLFLFLFISLSYFVFPSSVQAATTYDMADTSNFNIRIDGAGSGDYLDSFDTLRVGDLNGDGKEDIVVASPWADNNSRADSGSIYIIYNNILADKSGIGQAIDLSDSANYDLRFDGALANDLLSWSMKVVDLDNDGMQDLIFGAIGADNNSRGGSGSLYIIYGQLLRSFTDKNIDLSNSDNYSLRLDSPTAGDNFPDEAVETADLDNDGKQDLILGAVYADFNSRSASGSVFVIYNSLLSTFVDKNIDLADSNNYSLRFDGATAGDKLGYGAVKTADINNDGISDLLISAAYTNYNSLSDSGSVYLIYSNLISSLSSKEIDLSNSDNFSLRFDGSLALVTLGTRSVTVGDIDSDGRQDLVLGEVLRNGAAGSLYLISNNLISTFNSKTIHMLTSGNYNVRLDGLTANDKFGSRVAIFDFDGDSKNELFSGSTAVVSGRANAGSVYAFINSSFQYTSTGNNLSVDDLYQIRYNGSNALDLFGYLNSSIIPTDLNSDGKSDLLIGAQWADYNSRSNSGSVYLIYNFPHTVVPDESSVASTTTPTLTGSVSATNSTTDISGVQYLVDSNSPSGTWVACTATDGAFDEDSEDYSCALTNLALGSHTIYFRSYDENTSYTAQSEYASVSVTIQTQAQASEDVTPNLAPSGVSEPNNSDTAALGAKTVTSADEVEVSWDRPANTSNIDHYTVYYREIGESDWESEEVDHDADSITFDPGEGKYEWYLEITYTDGSTSTTDIYKFEIDQTDPIIPKETISLMDEIPGTTIYLPYGSPLVINTEDPDGDKIIEIWDWDKTIHYDTMVCGPGACDHGHVLTGNLTLVIYMEDEVGNMSEEREIKVSPFGVSAGYVSAPTVNAPAKITADAAVRGDTTQFTANNSPSSSAGRQLAPQELVPGIVSGAVDFPEPESRPEPPRQNIFQRIWNSILH